jgi:hypothetical protein
VDRDWDKELSKIDKQLASLSDDALLGPTPVQLPARAGSPAPAPKGAAAPRASAGVSGEPKATTSWGVYARLTLSVALGVGMVLWPYPARCGPGLAGYLAAVVVVVASGIWSSVWTWRHRASHAHTLSLLIILWGLILGSIEVLPRIGYAKPDLRHPAGWACPAGPAAGVPVAPK